MRFAVAAILVGVTACTVEGNQCLLDRECEAGEVCSRDHGCELASNVRVVKATWTIDGAPASEANCPPGEMYISFTANQPEDDLSFRPVPCFTGQFTVDKLPLRFDRVEVGIESLRAFAMIDDAGMAQLDLAP